MLRSQMNHNMSNKIEFKTKLAQDDKTTACGIYLPFEPKEVFGKARAPVKVTINGHTFRTTTACMGGCYLIPVNKTNRDGAGIKAGDTITVLMESDTEQRVVEIPSDFARALRANPKAAMAWEKLCFTHQKEYVNAVIEAKKPETRLRRIDSAIKTLQERKILDK